MSSEKKIFPRTKLERLKALELAWKQNDNLGTETILSTATRNRLNNIFPAYRNKVLLRGAGKAHFTDLAAKKQKAQQECALYCSHFLQVVNLCIARGEYSPAARAYYGLPVENEKLPRLITTSEVLLITEKTLRGEAERVAAGGVPMSNPGATQLQQKLDAFKALYTQSSTAKGSFTTGLKAVNELTKEVNGVIKKVWNEVETYYSELPRPKMREHARHWGVQYQRVGYIKKLSGTVTHAATGQPLAGVTLRLSGGRNQTVSNAQGRFTLSTTLMNEQTLTATLAGYLPATLPVALPEEKDTEVAVVMQPEGE